MTQANNTTPPTREIPVGLIVRPAELKDFAAALSAIPELELKAVAGVPQSAAPEGTAWYDDLRVMLSSGRVAAVLLATDPRAGAELAIMAAGYKVHVWRTPPAARTVAECIDVLRGVREAGVVYRIASSWDHTSEAIRSLLRERGGLRPILSELLVRAPGPPLDSWKASLVDAGGGVLATDAYDTLELLVALRGLPASVFATVGRCRPVGGLAPRETEDVAAAVLRYEGGGLAIVRATWDIIPYESLSLHHAAEMTLRVEATQASLQSADGRVVAAQALPPIGLKEELRRFAATIIEQSRQPRDAGALERHLAVTAVLETAYLSARTGQPETPRKLYEVQRWPEPRR